MHFIKSPFFFFVGSPSVCVAGKALRFLVLVICHKPFVFSLFSYRSTDISSCQFFCIVLYSLYAALFWGKFNVFAFKIWFNIFICNSSNKYQFRNDIRLTIRQKLMEWNTVPKTKENLVTFSACLTGAPGALSLLLSWHTELVEALHYKPDGRGFDSRWCHWNFPLT